jgi:diguanylate cyclase (GGDEF)-like protein
MTSTHDTSFTGMVLQTVGLVLLAVLCAFLRRSIDRDFMGYWSRGWAVLAVALAALFLSFRLPALRPLLQSVYHFGEMVFGYLLLRGCHSYSDRRGPAPRKAWLAAPAAALALGLGQAPLNAAFIAQAAIMAAVFGLAFARLWPLRLTSRAGPALRILLVALALLALDFTHYVVFLLWLALDARPLPVLYTVYAPVVDLLLEILLGFGMVTLLMEETHRQLRDANRELRQARDRLETAARTDPLTDSLNRHALDAVIETHREKAGVGGSVAVVDIDDLKRFNDEHGHTAGDIAIRAVARAIRALVRSDDLVFRWGGDEFLLVLFGLDAEEAQNRMAGVNAALTGMRLPGVDRPVDVAVSVGVAPILPGVSLDQAIEQADNAMYRLKHARKAAGAAV